MKTSELTGVVLNWAVAMSENWAGADFEVKPYSTDWSQGGPIIEREFIGLQRWNEEHEWAADIGGDFEQYGPTPLIAACRCYVASKLGDDVDVPQELL